MVNNKTKSRAIFLDRDGVINKVILKENGRPFSPRDFNEFEFTEGIKSVLEKFKEKGFLNIVITNQPDIARGLLNIAELNKMHEIIRKKLPIDDILICTHDDEDNCFCRKPKPGMLMQAAKKWDIDLDSSFMVGDSKKDIGAASAAGCTAILIDTAYNKGIKADYRAYGIEGVARVILNGGK